MILVPAIDIKGGKVVRLFQGKFSHVTEYDDDPLKIAKQWEAIGAQWLHVVDLDGAQSGIMKNQSIVGRIVQGVKIPVQVGGGIRGEAIVEYLLNEAQVARVILGTKAIENRDFLKKMIAVYGDKICVSLDCSNGLVAQRGWVATTDIKATELALELETMGLAWMVYTDIARDGTLMGPNFDQLQIMLNALTKIKMIASGGIATLDDVKKLAAMKGIEAAITGKAIYEGKLDFQEAAKVAATFF